MMMSLTYAILDRDNADYDNVPEYHDADVDEVLVYDDVDDDDVPEHDENVGKALMKITMMTMMRR